LPWQPAKTAPENDRVLILTRNPIEVFVGWKEPNKEGFLGRWKTLLPNGKEHALFWPIAWTNLPDLPNKDELEHLIELDEK
jgi:hypothetical protein